MGVRSAREKESLGWRGRRTRLPFYREREGRGEEERVDRRHTIDGIQKA
jgi:hypothetical protein